jgi:hypothetical protein
MSSAIPGGFSNHCSRATRQVRSLTRIRRMVVVLSMIFGVAAQASAQQIPLLATLPVTPASNPGLAANRAALVAERAALHSKIDALNVRCEAVKQGSAAESSCNSDRSTLLASLNSHIQRSNDFNAAVKLAIDSAPDTETDRVISGMNALAKHFGWSTDKRARLDRNLHHLDLDQDPTSTGTQIRNAWQDILARAQDADLVREASANGGLGFPGAGKQSPATNDCTIFALANAAGLPYGLVSARANELIRHADWHTANDRANPQSVIEKQGLNGGEVILMAEAFGQAEVIPSSAFASTLNSGRPVMVNVVPSNGNRDGGHEVVLTKTFQHGADTWFVMMNSAQDPDHYLFLSAAELNIMLKEKGVAYRPEPGNTPKPLRSDGPQ